ncbi:NinI-like serine-threonine phosphatase [Vibrio phage pYD21-A]|uniref:NinI-like serine-threonine phosphatase n=1 Tax=Vibrio phage pYD21-A TaxID=754049 RepID=UPI0002C05936|nr:NinI-like serine-threonine phosphatase [Vibrio phage pYD21-A]AGH16046.1 serine/threonine-protein phosphatase 1 [Vibrio phage pYD21-A]
MKIKKFDIESEKRIFVVGDIHGEITKLNEKLDEIGFDKDADILFSVGDLIDRGEDSLACLALIQESWFEPVRGNHEELMINSVVHNDSNNIACWMQNGSRWYLDLNEEDRMYADDLAKLANETVPYVIEINYQGRKIVICHADYPSNDYDGNVNAEELFDIVWSRTRIESFIKHQKTSRINGADQFIFGHTPVRHVSGFGNCLYIDTGAVFGKDLTVIRL